jgi:hypothetical protein
MTERDVTRIETKLAVQLPSHYRQFLIDQGTAVAKAKRGGGSVPFFTMAKEIIDANADLRANPSLRDTNRDTEPWPLKYLIVGTDGGGDDWCVDLEDEREVIWFFDSEAHGTFRHATPSTWAAYLEKPQAPKIMPEPRANRIFACKKGTPAPDAEGDGSFSLKDDQGRDWVCFEKLGLTPEQLLARVRGELRWPSWLGEKGLRDLMVTSLEELRAELTKVRK